MPSANAAMEARPPPPREVTEGAKEKDRSEIAAASVIATHRVKAAFLDRLEDRQFEGNPRAQNALAEFIGACAEGQAPTELELLASVVVYYLGSGLKWRDKEAVITAAIEAGTGVTRTYL
jgi:hypothetical protein